VAESKCILIVDDEPQIVEVLEQYLLDEGFTVEKAHDGASALTIFASRHPALVILDLKLPGMSGHEAFQQMRAQSDTPVIMLTSRSDEVDRVIGLELGADDYITKPFSPREVVARVKAVLRRLAHAEIAANVASTLVAAGARAVSRPGRIVIGGLEIDPDDHEVHVDGKEVELTPTEFRILEVLAQNPGRTFTRAQLLDRAKAESLDVFDRTLDRHIANLRHKIEPEPGKPIYILTVFGVGYKMARTPRSTQTT
jgi:two-component system, OmpR family, alkaline phosphatase synthesis response regulator PhoP